MLSNMKALYGVWVVTLMSQGAVGEMYNTLEGWDYGDDYTYNRDDEGVMSVLKEDVETVLGLQVVVKSMLDDVIGGQHAQTEHLSSILGSSILTSTEPTQTTPGTTAAQRDIDMEILEDLVEELQRNSTQGSTFLSSNNSLSSSSTPQTTQAYTPQRRPRLF